jgi:hypothetical protein
MGLRLVFGRYGPIETVSRQKRMALLQVRRCISAEHVNDLA